MSEKKIRALKADEIECRVSNISDKGVTLLLYKNARVDQAILDETFGVYGWQRSHRLVGDDLYCTVSIWDEEKHIWIAKEDVGTEGDYEKVKGLASDAFKRACVNIGIGRELYSAPFIFIPISVVQTGEKNGKRFVKDRFTVQSIAVSEKKVITSLTVTNQNGTEVFSYKERKQKSLSKTEEPQKPKTRNAGGKDRQSVLPEFTLRELDILYEELYRTGVTEEALLKRYGLDSMKDMSRDIYMRALSGLRKTRTAA